MKYSFVLCYIIICTTGATHKSRIYGGQNATSGQFPFMVALNDYYHYCNGVILTPSWILTTSYCIFYTSEAAEVYVGNHVNLDNGTSYRFFEKVTHRDYDDWTAQNDIGLIRINAVLEYSDTIQPIELGTSPTPNSTCTILGWGSTENQIDSSSQLKYVDATVIDSALCQNISAENSNEFYLGPEQVCTVNTAGQGACFGDEGGALICDGKLSGVYSYNIGFGCGEGLPDVFTSIESYSDWILSFIGL